MKRFHLPLKDPLRKPHTAGGKDQGFWAKGGRKGPLGVAAALRVLGRSLPCALVSRPVEGGGVWLCLVSPTLDTGLYGLK